ncbi:low molecular weight phosphotyrosine protein phosphatase isoform X6 [Festucalex cinctus]
MATTSGKSVLFVCLGNICRSPIAEAVFRKMATEAGVVDQWLIDSGATSDWNVGCPPDARGLACLKAHAVDSAHRARQVLAPFITTNTLAAEDDFLSELQSGKKRRKKSVPSRRVTRMSMLFLVRRLKQ